MENREKAITTTMEGTEKRAAVEAMHSLLNSLREVPGWGNRENGLIIPLDDGTEAEVTRQNGETEAFLVEVRPASPTSDS